MREQNQKQQMALLENNKRMHEQSSLSSKQKKKERPDKSAPSKSSLQRSFGDDSKVDEKMRITGQIKKETFGHFNINRSKYSGAVHLPQRDRQNLSYALRQHMLIIDSMEDSEGQKKVRVDFEAFAKSLSLDDHTSKALDQNFKDIEKGMYGEGVDQIIAFHKMNYKNYVASSLS